MSRKVQIVLLCEDTQQEAFTRRFLTEMGWSTHRLRIEKAPAGAGSAVQFVRDRFPQELKAYRMKLGAVGQCLLVMVDGDRQGVESREAELDRACKAKGVSTRQPEERVAVFVPTWRIETWLAYLDGATVDEARSDYPRMGRPRDCQQQVEVLAAMCRKDQLRQPAPPSLIAACDEYNHRLASHTP